MAVYSTFDTIENYNRLFREFILDENNYRLLNKNKKLIYFVSGLGLSNSIHEMFVKSIVSEYEMAQPSMLSNNKRKKIISKYKAPKMIIDFSNSLNLDLADGFNIRKVEIQRKFSHINTISGIESALSIQRDKRNDYLHGDFDFSVEIRFQSYLEDIIVCQQLHCYLFEIIRYCFLKNISNLPDISQLV